MRRIVFTLVACFIALGSATEAGAATTPTTMDLAETSITCDDVGGHSARLYRTLLGRPADLGGLGYWVGLQRDGLALSDVAYWMTRGPEFQARYGHLDDRGFVDAMYHNVLGRPADPAGRAYWLDQLATIGRHGVATWITLSPEMGARRPLAHSTVCDKVWNQGFTEVRPGIAVGRWDSTVVVVADRDLVDYRAVDGGRTYATRIEGDIVVNANWFTGAGTLAPVVADGITSGSADIVERGQIVAYRPGCGGHGPGDLDHIWMGNVWTPGPCVETAVSGISLVHHGRRADAYPGITLGGYTGTNLSHSFIGFNDDQIVVVATTSMTAPKLGDFAIALGVTEGVMLDGGGSTQITTPTERIGSSRPVTTFAILDSRAGPRG